MALSNIGELSLFKKRSQGAQEFEALLELLPHPTLIADAHSGRIVLGNAQATELTAYTRKELSELELGTLLPDLALVQLREAAEALSAELVKRSSASLAVSIAVHPLNGGEHWSALSIQPTAQVRQRSTQEKINRDRWEALHMLSLAAQQKELASTYRRILQSGNLLTGAQHMALYLPAPSGALALESVLGSGFDFPPSLTEADLGHLRTPMLWQRGKAVKAPLHKLADKTKLVYLASTPLDLTQPGNGLLVAADPDGAPSTELLTMLQILAATATTTTLNSELNRELRQRLGALGETVQLSEQLQENVQDGLVYFDHQLQLLDLNPAAESMLGYTAHEAQGRHAEDILISTRPLLSTLEDALLQNRLVDAGDIKLHHRDGNDFLAHVRVISISGEDGSRLAVLITDLSEHEAFHLRSQQLQQRAVLGDLTAIIAHEVRNPINNISTGLQLMQMELAEDDPMQEQIQRLQEDCDRLEHRMKSVQNFSRTLDHNPEPLDIGEFCLQQLERWKPRMARKNIDQHIQIAPDTPPIMGDRRALDQVFTNLITNAIQAMEDQNGGVIGIKIKASQVDDKQWVDVHFSDTGPGIPDDLRARVFDPFFTTKKEEGTGLGLAISRSIIMTHKGEIDLESFPGGTLFKMRFPAAHIDTFKGQDST